MKNAAIDLEIGWICFAVASPLAKPDRIGQGRGMDALTLFGLVAVTFTMICYMKEAAHPAWTLGFAAGCLMGSAYGFLQGAWPFGLIEFVWTIVALRKWNALRGTIRPIA